MNEENVSVKIFYEDECRRFPSTKNSLNFEWLLRLLSTHYKPEDQTAKFCISYKDDEGDLVSIFSEEEMKEAVKLIKDKIYLFLNRIPEGSSRKGFSFSQIATEFKFSENLTEQKLEEKEIEKMEELQVVQHLKDVIIRIEKPKEDVVMIEKPKPPASTLQGATANQVHEISSQVSKNGEKISNQVRESVVQESQSISKNTRLLSQSTQQKVAKEGEEVLRQFEKKNRILLEETAKQQSELCCSTASNTAHLAQQVSSLKTTASKVSEQIKQQTVEQVEKDSVLAENTHQFVQKAAQQNIAVVEQFRKEQQERVALEASKVSHENDYLSELAAKTSEFVNNLSQKVANKVTNDSKQIQEK